MKLQHTLYFLLFAFSSLHAHHSEIPNDILNILHKPKYDHSIWGMYVKDLKTGRVLYDLNSEKFFSPASTTKIFSAAALLYAYGDDYRFRTPVFATGPITNGELKGNLVLVGQGDLTMGGRQPDFDKISYSKLDHINANYVPGALITKEDPLFAFNSLAEQMFRGGLKVLSGDVIIDDRLFETTEKRGVTLSPIMINENMIDVVVNPTKIDQDALVMWRPQVPGYTVENKIKTVAQDQSIDLKITSDETGHIITVSGSIPVGSKDIVRTIGIKDPAVFARLALLQALQKQGVKINLPTPSSEAQDRQIQNQNIENQYRIQDSEVQTPNLPMPKDIYTEKTPIALWTSPSLSEYAKLILKVSHNVGADLVPMLLAAQHGKKTFDEGMLILGDFITNTAKIPQSGFAFADAAGGNDNRLTPRAIVQFLEFMYRQDANRFKTFSNALPIMGVDGSLEDFAKGTRGVGKIRAKPGTGVSVNLAAGTYFLNTQALAGYIDGRDGHKYAFMLVVNNGELPSLTDVFPIFEEQSQISNMIYGNTSVGYVLICDP